MGASAWPKALIVGALALLVLGSGSAPSATRHVAVARPIEKVSGGPTGTYIVPPGIHKIRHVIIVMQENRSFDSYFRDVPRLRRHPHEERRAHRCVPGPIERWL